MITNRLLNTLESNKLKSLNWLINNSYSQIKNFDIENIYLNNSVKISDNEFFKKNKDIGIDWICKGGIFIDNNENGKILTFLSLITIDSINTSLILCNTNNFELWKNKLINYSKSFTKNKEVNNYIEFLFESNTDKKSKHIILCTYFDYCKSNLENIEFDYVIFDDYNEIVINKDIVKNLSLVKSNKRWCITSLLCLENNDIYFNTLSILSVEGMINRIDNRRNFINNCVRENTKKNCSKNIHYTTSIIKFNKKERQIYDSVFIKNNEIKDIMDIDIIKNIRKIDTNDTEDYDFRKNNFTLKSFNSIKQNKDNKTIQCPICCENVDKFLIVLNCGHVFCISCIIMMLDYKYSSCSICRQDIEIKNENVYYIISNNNLVPISTRILYTLNIIKNSVGKVIICVKSQKVITKLIKILNNNDIHSITIGSWLSKFTERLKFNNNPDVKVLITTYSIINGNMFDNITNIIFVQPNIDSNNPIKDERSILNIGDRNDIILTRLIMKDTPEESYYKNINNYFLT